MVVRWIVLAFAGCGLLGSSLAAQQPRPYDGIQAGLDAFRLAEERRQFNVAQQLALNDQLKYWAGIPNVRGETIYYGAPAPPVNLDYAYAYGPAVVRGWRGGYVAGPLTVFEPWPFVPGDIYGYTYYLPVRQPIGQWQGQTGPNRWESHPVYDPPLPNLRPLPPLEAPPAAAAPPAPPAPPAADPPAAPRRTPREF